MVGAFVSQSDSAWSIYLQFLQIRLCSPKFSRGDLVLLQSLIDEFFPQFLNEFGENHDLKANGHFLQHYHKMIEIFGPLVKTLRFEAKHSYFRCLAGNKNGKNIFESMENFPSYVHVSCLFSEEQFRTQEPTVHWSSRKSHAKFH